VVVEELAFGCDCDPEVISCGGVSAFVLFLPDQMPTTVPFGRGKFQYRLKKSTYSASGVGSGTAGEGVLHVCAWSDAENYRARAFLAALGTPPSSCA
jgi:hypothetical protein